MVDGGGAALSLSLLTPIETYQEGERENEEGGGGAGGRRGNPRYGERAPAPKSPRGTRLRHMIGGKAIGRSRYGRTMLTSRGGREGRAGGLLSRGGEEVLGLCEWEEAH